MPFPYLPSPPALFPTYLVPSQPFRRKSSTDSTASSSSYTSSISTTSSISESANSLSGHASHLRCSRCAADLALSSQIISKGFTGRHGKAYLVSPSTSAIPSINTSTLSTTKARNDALPNLPNTYTHKPVPRQLVTGAHTVGDISCAQCGSVLGWKYVHAEEEAQKYKVGKFILETKRVCRTSVWEGDSGALSGDHELDARLPGSGSEEVEFDSQDEDECEDLFMGVWTPQLATRRRREKRRLARAEMDG